MNRVVDIDRRGKVSAAGDMKALHEWRGFSVIGSHEWGFSIDMHEHDVRLRDFFVAETRAALGAQDFSRGGAIGRELPLPNTIAFALNDAPESAIV